MGGRDRALLDAQGQPVEPRDVGRLYGQAFAVRESGVDVCSHDHAARTAMPETKRPVYMDLAKWESVRVPPGQLAIDPKLGRFQFSGGKSAKLKLAGRCHIGWGEARDVFVNGHYAYLATAESSFPVCIYDLANPASPTKVGMIEAGDMEWPTRVVVRAGRAYVPSRYRTFAIHDVSNPRRPKRLNTLNLCRGRDRGAAGARSVAVGGGYAYVTVHDRGLDVVDVSNPKHAHSVAHVKAPPDFDPMGKPRLVGDRLFVPSKTQLLSYDVSNPKKPVRLPTLLAACANVRVAGRFAYLPGGNGVFSIADVSNPQQPRVVGRCRAAPPSKQGGLDDVVVKGRYAFATVRSRPEERVCFVAIDVSKPDAPKVVAEAKVDPAFAGAKAFDGMKLGRPDAAVPVFLDPHMRCLPTGIALRGDHVYVSDEFFGLWAFDVSDPRQPKLVAGAKEGGEVSAVCVSRGLAFAVQNMEGGLAIVDVSDPRAPRWKSYYHTSTDIWAVASYQGRYAYFSDYDGGPGRHIYAIDAADPSKPKLVDRLSGRQARSAAVAGRRLFIDGMIFDLADPAHPRKLADIPGRGAEFSMRQSAAGGKLYTCVERTFRVIDISDSSHPCALGSLELGDPGFWCERMQAMAGRVLVPYGKRGAVVVDVSNSGSPRVATRYSPKSLAGGLKRGIGKLLHVDRLTREVVISAEMAGRYLYTADYWDNVYVLDVRNPSKPKLLGDAPAYYGWGMDVQGGYMYRASLDGIRIFDIPRPSEAPVGHVTTVANLK